MLFFFPPGFKAMGPATLTSVSAEVCENRWWIHFRGEIELDSDDSGRNQDSSGVSF